MNRGLKTNSLTLLGLTLAFASCSPSIDSPSAHDVIPTADLPGVEAKVRNGDCEAFDKLITHFRRVGDEDGARKWLDTAIDERMTECAPHTAHLIGSQLRTRALENKTNQYDMLMSAYKYQKYAFFWSASDDEAKFAQDEINEINYSLWILQRDHDLTAVSGK